MFGNRCPKCNETFDGSFFAAPPDETRFVCSGCNDEYVVKDDFSSLEIRVAVAIFIASFAAVIGAGGAIFGWNNPWTLVSAACAGAMVATISLREAIFWLVPSKYWLISLR